MTVVDVLIMIGMQVTLKTGYEAIILPLTTFLAKKLGKYEANQIKEPDNTVLNKQGEED